MILVTSTRQFMKSVTALVILGIDKPGSISRVLQWQAVCHFESTLLGEAVTFWLSIYVKKWDGMTENETTANERRKCFTYGHNCCLTTSAKQIIQPENIVSQHQKLAFWESVLNAKDSKVT